MTVLGWGLSSSMRNKRHKIPTLYTIPTFPPQQTILFVHLFLFFISHQPYFTLKFSFSHFILIVLNYEFDLLLSYQTLLPFCFFEIEFLY